MVENLAREVPSQGEVAARIGMALNTFCRKLKASPELRGAYAARRARRWGKLEDGGIDAGLYLLSLVTPRGITLTQEEIAAACGCSRGLIYLIEKEAVKKLRLALERRGFREAA